MIFLLGTVAIPASAQIHHPARTHASSKAPGYRRSSGKKRQKSKPKRSSQPSAAARSSHNASTHTSATSDFRTSTSSLSVSYTENRSASEQFRRSMKIDRLTRQARTTASQRIPLRSIFRARPKDPGALNESFSGTFFKTTYQGKEEVFGVIASHALTEGGADFSLQRFFLADVYIDGSFVEVPMEVVQLGAPGMADVSLVKIPEEIIPFIDPYPLMSEPLESNEPFVSFGFVGDELKQVENRYVLNHRSSYSMRTMMPTEPGSYVGGCGGPLEGVDANGELVLAGIHTGSSGKVGYATSARFLNMLVDAYYHQGEGYFPLEINGQHIMDLRVDEYVSDIAFLDRKGKVLATHQIAEKFSYTAVNQVLQEHPVRAIELTIARVSWQERNPNLLQLYTKVRRVSYDLRSGELTELRD